MPRALRLVLLPLLAAIARRTRGRGINRPGDGELPIEGLRPPAPKGPGVARAARARDTVERGLGLAILLSLLAAGWEEVTATDPPRGTTQAIPWTSIPVDVAADGPSRLRLLPGLGIVRTRAILADRERLGPVPRVADLVRVHGLGAKTVAALGAAGAVVGLARAIPGASAPRLGRAPTQNPSGTAADAGGPDPSSETDPSRAGSAPLERPKESAR